MLDVHVQVRLCATVTISALVEAELHDAEVPLNITKCTRSRDTSLSPSSSGSQHSVPSVATFSGTSQSQLNFHSFKSRINFNKCLFFSVIVICRGFGKQGYQCQSKSFLPSFLLKIFRLFRSFKLRKTTTQRHGPIVRAVLSSLSSLACSYIPVG